jgi:hypothetical protein
MLRHNDSLRTTALQLLAQRESEEESEAARVSVGFAGPSDPRAPLLERDFCELLLRCVAKRTHRHNTQCGCEPITAKIMYNEAFAYFAEKVYTIHAF